MKGVTRPEEIDSEFATAVHRGDLDQLCALHEDDAVVIAPPGEQGAGGRRDGLPAIRDHLAALLAMQPRMTILASQAHTKGDLPLLSSHWRATVALANGRHAELEAHGSELARRQPDGGWRHIIDNPEAPTNVGRELVR